MTILQDMWHVMSDSLMSSLEVLQGHGYAYKCQVQLVQLQGSQGKAVQLVLDLVLIVIMQGTV